jgi:hypothetical protein
MCLNLQAGLQSRNLQLSCMLQRMMTYKTPSWLRVIQYADIEPWHIPCGEVESAS